MCTHVHLCVYIQTCPLFITTKALASTSYTSVGIWDRTLGTFASQNLSLIGSRRYCHLGSCFGNLISSHPVVSSKGNWFSAGKVDQYVYECTCVYVCVCTHVETHMKVYSKFDWYKWDVIHYSHIRIRHTTYFVNSIRSIFMAWFQWFLTNAHIPSQSTNTVQAQSHKWTFVPIHLPLPPKTYCHPIRYVIRR